MSGQNLRDVFLEFAQPSKVYGKQDMELATQMSHVGWSYMQQMAKQVVLEAGTSPVLFSYGSDATALVATTTVHLQLGETRQSRRAGQCLSQQERQPGMPSQP